LVACLTSFFVAEWFAIYSVFFRTAKVRCRTENGKF
jgi:hypothetical protein